MSKAIFTPSLPGYLGASWVSQRVVFFFAGAQDDQHDVLGHELRQHLGHQVEALLVRQPGNDAQEGRLGKFFVQAEGLHQGGLVLVLALQVLRARKWR